MSRIITVRPFMREHSSLAHLGIEYHSRNKQRVKVRKPKTAKVRTPKTVKVHKPKAVVVDAAKQELQREKTRLGSTRCRAKKLGVPFDLTIEQTREVRQRPCAYCGTTEQPRQLDRIVPAEGYVMENVAAACKRCNMVKSRWLSFDEMRKVAEVLGWRE